MQNIELAVSTRQRILNCAASLFAQKGFTETTVRELAEAVGLKGASIYNHFPSKMAILECMLEDYVENNSGMFQYDRNEVARKIQEDPTPDGILSCMQLVFDEGSQEYYTKVLSVILQEQHRNPIVGEYMRDNFAFNERNVQTVFDILQELRIIRVDADADFWKKMASSLFYTFSGRMLLGIGDYMPDYMGMGMVDLLRTLFEIMLKICGE